MDTTQIQALFVGVLGLSGAATWLLTRRHNEEIELSDATGRSITAIADAAETLVAPMTAELKRISEACAGYQIQLDQLKRHVEILEDQVIRMGAAPHPPPD